MTQQGSLAPLFANLGVVASSGGLPPALQQAVVQVLAQRSSLDQNLTGSDVKNAFESSGLFLEASLASGSVSTASGLPDLKAALIVLRQTLLSSLGTADSPAATATAQLQSAVPQSAVPATAVTAASNEAALPHATSDVNACPIAVSRNRRAGNSSAADRVIGDLARYRRARATAGAALNLLQEVLQGSSQGNLQGNLQGNCKETCGKSAVRRWHWRCRMTAATMTSPSIPTRRRRRFAARCHRRKRLPRHRSHPMRRSQPVCGICLTTRTLPSRGRRCCRLPHCRASPIPRRRGSIRPCRAGILKFHS